MKINKIIKLIDKTQPKPNKLGKIFKIEFIKRTDGQLRKMRCRLGVKHNLTFEGQNYDPSDNDLRTVWSVDDKGYRNIPLDGITKFNGVEI